MGKKRRGRGEGGLEQLPSRNWRAVHAKVVNGKLERSSKTFPTKPEAQRWLAAQQEHAKPIPAGTLGQWLDVWLPLHRTKWQPATVRGDRKLIDRWIRPRLASVKLRDMDALSVEKWLAGLAEAGASRTTRHNAGKVLRKILAAAVKAGLIPVNPFTGRVKLPSPSRPKTTSLTEDEARRLVNAGDELGPYESAAVRVWLELGLRPEEFIALRWEDYDPLTGLVAITRAIEYHSPLPTPSKTPRVRPLPLSPETRAALERHRGGKVVGWMFPSPTGRSWWQANFRRQVWDVIVERAGIRCLPKTVRHTTATLLLRAGVSIRAVAERLGHTDPAMTLRCYAHALPDDQDRAAAAWGKMLG